MNREQWLSKAVDLLRDGLFKESGAIVPDVKVSVGFAGGGTRNSTIGQYWHPNAVKDGVPQIYISPVIDDPIRALDILVHELVHACTPGMGHRKPFGDLARKLGLEGKLTSTYAGEVLKAKLQALVDTLGAFPHSGINISLKKKQATALLKVACPACGYTIRVTQKWVDTGLPICPCSEEMRIA